MAGIKAILATNEADKELHRHLQAARNALDRAQGVCLRVARIKDSPQARKAQQYQRQLRRLLSEVGRIGYLGQPQESDPDMTPEKDRRVDYSKVESQVYVALSDFEDFE